MAEKRPAEGDTAGSGVFSTDRAKRVRRVRGGLTAGRWARLPNVASRTPAAREAVPEGHRVPSWRRSAAGAVCAAGRAGGPLARRRESAVARALPLGPVYPPHDINHLVSSPGRQRRG